MTRLLRHLLGQMEKTLNFAGLIVSSVVFVVLQPNLAGAESALKAGSFDIFPFSYVEDGVRKGVLPDFYRALERSSGLRLIRQDSSVARLFRDVEIGNLDFVFAYKLPEMVSGVDFIADVGCISVVLVTQKGSGIKSLSDVRGKRLGFLRGGFTFASYGDSLGSENIQVSTNLALYRMLARGNRIDAFVSNAMMVDSWIYGPSPHNIKLPAGWRDNIGSIIPLADVPVAIGMSKKSKHRDKIDAIQKGVSQLISSGQTVSIPAKYGSRFGWTCHK
jgi:ABC-type amino acid transport substrate-binding protein